MGGMLAVLTAFVIFVALNNHRDAEDRSMQEGGLRRRSFIAPLHCFPTRSHRTCAVTSLLRRARLSPTNGVPSPENRAAECRSGSTP